MFINLLTKEQVLRVYGVKAPARNTEISTRMHDGTKVVILESQFKSTYGKKLYRCEHVEVPNV